MRDVAVLQPIKDENFPHFLEIQHDFPLRRTRMNLQKIKHCNYSQCITLANEMEIDDNEDKEFFRIENEPYCLKSILCKPEENIEIPWDLVENLNNENLPNKERKNKFKIPEVVFKQKKNKSKDR